MFVGTTCVLGTPYIHLTSHVHTFRPVPVGSHVYPKQVTAMPTIGLRCTGFEAVFVDV